MDQPGFDPEVDLTDFETRLGRLRPAPIALDRDRMLFEAGRASARADGRVRLGYAVAAGFALLAVGLGGLLARERSERRALEVRIATRDRDVSPPPIVPDSMPRPIDPSSYLALTRRFLAGGLDSSPAVALKNPPESPSVGPTPVLVPLRVRGSGGLIDL